jgi:hypothetical protein
LALPFALCRCSARGNGLERIERQHPHRRVNQPLWGLSLKLSLPAPKTALPGQQQPIHSTEEVIETREFAGTTAMAEMLIGV